MIKRILITSSIVLCALNSVRATVRFVSQSGSGAAPYNSWATANSNLQTVLNASAAGDTVWVAAGNYQPSGIGYTVPNNVKVFGGFDGTETTYSERDFNANVSTISSPNGRAFHFANTGTATVLDGFTITGAIQSAVYIEYSSPRINNCIFVNNSYMSGQGGAVYIVFPNGALISRPVFTDCIFESNTSDVGGAIYSFDGFVLNNCKFNNNSASTWGGAIYQQGDFTNADISIVNCLFTNNTATQNGGAIGYDDATTGSFKVINSTFINNSSANGGVLSVTYWDSSPHIIPGFTNCVMWNNSSTINYRAHINSKVNIDYSLIQDATCPPITTCNNNLYGVNPLFVDAANGNFALQVGSPAINAGTPDTTGLHLLSYDLGNNPRIIGARVDMGAYEYGCHASNIVYVDSAATGNNDGTNWVNAFTSLSTAIDLAHNCDMIDSILVAQGTYYPDSLPPTTSTTTARDRTFYFIRGDLAVLGGYPNGGGVRNTSINPTILSGDLDKSGTINNNDAHHVVMVVGNVTQAINNIIIDGTTITGGNANGSGAILINGSNISRVSGGGVYNNYATLNISNSNFADNSSSNSGGGMYNNYATLNISNSNFSGNQTTYNGGALYNLSSTLLLNNTLVSGNTATFAAGLYNYFNSSTEIYNCIFNGNSANVGGGAILNLGNSHSLIVNSLLTGNKLIQNVVGSAIYNESANTSCTIINSTVSGNSGSTATTNAIYGNGNGLIKIDNSLIYNNSGGIFGGTLNASYSLIQGLTGTANGNLNGNTTNPLFINAPSHTTAPFTGGDYRLQFCSPAINAGNNISIPTGITTDLVGNARIIGTAVDMGAYEKQSDGSSLGNNAALSQSSSNTLNFIPTCEEGDWTWYAIPNNPDSLSFAINWGTNNNTAKAAAQVQLTVDANHHITSNNVDSAIITMKRYWNVDLGTASLNEPVSIRFFFDAADTTAMRNAINALNIGTADKLVWFKTNGAAYSPGVVAYNNINNGNFTKLTPTYGHFNGITYAQFDAISSFSGGTLGLDLDAGSPLPLDLLSFKATAVENHKTQLVWHTANERNVDVIEVERSVSGNSWEFITMQEALGGYNNVYTAWDLTPLNGDNLYRLKMIDEDGSYNYSKIEKVYFTNKGASAIAVYPNPTTGSFTISVNGLGNESGNLNIYDVLGRLVHTATITNENTIITGIPFRNGVYKIVLQYGKQLLTQKLVVEK